jgi:hypothetical protein
VEVARSEAIQRVEETGYAIKAAASSGM